MVEVVTDLFGDACTLASGRRGRPAHRWAKSHADKVTLGLAMGYSDAEIADGLRISLPTLRKYYFPQLKARSMQRTRFELWRAALLADLGNAGNVGAVKELGKIVEKRGLARAAAAFSEKGEPIGKKEAVRRAAERRMKDGGDWGDDLIPERVN